MVLRLFIGTMLVSSSYDETLVIWDVENCCQKFALKVAISFYYCRNEGTGVGSFCFSCVCLVLLTYILVQFAFLFLASLFLYSPLITTL